MISRIATEKLDANAYDRPDPLQRFVRRDFVISCENSYLRASETSAGLPTLPVVDFNSNLKTALPGAAFSGTRTES
jgi:hypothetical protein